MTQFEQGVARTVWDEAACTRVCMPAGLIPVPTVSTCETLSVGSNAAPSPPTSRA
jgi:hypothetical protein